MASTMTYTQSSVDAFSKLALAQFQTLFWDVCKTNGWTLSDMEDKVLPETLDNMLTNAMLNGPSTKVITDDNIDQERTKEIEQLPTQQTREDAPKTTPTPTPTPVSAAEPAAPVTMVDPKKVKGLKFKGAKIDLPYLPGMIDYSKCCQCVKINGGLLSPCLTHVKDGEFCKPCNKLLAAGMTDGTLADRQACQLVKFVSKKSGKTEISFATYLAKRGATIAEFNEFLAAEIHPGFQIPLTEEYTAIDKKKAKKASNKSKDDDSSVSSAEDKPKRKPGRPKGSGKKKEEKPKQSTEEAVENELFADIPSEAPKPIPRESNQEVVETKPVEKAAEDPVMSDIEDEEDEDDDGVVEFTEDGVNYARDEENSVFRLNDDGEPEDCVGSWDPIAKKILHVDGL